jgi:hypothetical protein
MRISIERQNGHKALSSAAKLTSNKSKKHLDAGQEGEEPGTKGSRKNKFTFSAPIHPTQRRCENTEYGGYSLIFAPF